MAPRKVNKEEKRREVALACSDLVHQGIRKITVAEVARIAGIGKGTVYEYFENKEDIIFEIINIHIEQYHQDFLNSLCKEDSTKEKVFKLLKFVIDDSEEMQLHLNGYKDYLSVVLSEENSEMKQFNASCTDFFTQQLGAIINEGIQKGELVEEAKNLIPGLMCFEKGAALMKMSEVDFDAKKTCYDFIDSIFRLIEVKQ